MAHTCRGTIPLAKAHIEVGDTCHMVLTSGGRSYHLKATSEAECQCWVSAMQEAKANATLLMHHSGEKDSLYLCVLYVSARNNVGFTPSAKIQCQFLKQAGFISRNTGEWDSFRGVDLNSLFLSRNNIPEYLLKGNNMVHLCQSEGDKTAAS